LLDVWMSAWTAHLQHHCTERLLSHSLQARAPGRRRRCILAVGDRICRRPSPNWQSVASTCLSSAHHIARRSKSVANGSRACVRSFISSRREALERHVQRLLPSKAAADLHRA
jgi:hypothetical protein